MRIQTLDGTHFRLSLKMLGSKRLSKFPKVRDKTANRGFELGSLPLQYSCFFYCSNTAGMQFQRVSHISHLTREGHLKVESLWKPMAFQNNALCTMQNPHLAGSWGHYTNLRHRK